MIMGSVMSELRLKNQVDFFSPPDRRDQLQAARRRLKAAAKSTGLSACTADAIASNLYFSRPRTMSIPPIKKTAKVLAATAGQNGAAGRRVAASDTPAAINPT